ncbi:MAG: hypothetical protein D6674_03640 [Acidobacteria bacterium]|jgi:hypothetical protein|nr:MAG: hypothetical protein D6674_03640 [Acidobacteriota bacterium]
MVREALKLLFLVVSYNFILSYLSSFLPFRVYPEDPEGILLTVSFASALYLAWLSGSRERTVVWLGYVFLFQIIGFSLVRADYHVLLQFLPPFLITLSLIWLFESPSERRLRKLEEERRRLEEELNKNSLELKNLIEQINLSKELVESLLKEKEHVEKELELLKNVETARREELEVEREELLKRLGDAQKKVLDYRERFEKLSKVNRELFQLIESLQEKEKKDDKGELSKLRQERKRLSKELLQMQELLEDLMVENRDLSAEMEETKRKLEEERGERIRLELELENHKRIVEGKRRIYAEMLEDLLENVEFEAGVPQEFSELSREARREFFKELLLLNMKDTTERFETMKGYKNLFKLKPKGGRIYFTYGDKKRWKVVGLLRGEDNAQKIRYAREHLIKYKTY